MNFRQSSNQLSDFQRAFLLRFYRSQFWRLQKPQMVRIFIGPLLAYFAQLYIVSDNSDIREEDLNLLEKQILGGLWK